MTVKLSHERKVRSLAKKTLGSTRVGRAMRLPWRQELAAGKVLAIFDTKVLYLERSEEVAGSTFV